MKNKFLFLFSAVACTVVAGYSQTTDKNRISSEVISVEKGYDPQVKAGSKTQFSPDESPENSTKLPVSYRTDAEAAQFDFTASSVAALVMDGQVPAALYPNYLKGGIGYNLSTLLEGYYSHSWGKNTFGAALNHDRAERKLDFLTDNSVFNHSDASLSFKHTAGRYDLGVYANYAYNAFTNNGSRLAEEYSSALPLILRHNEFTGGVFIRSHSGYRAFDHLNLEASYLNGPNKTGDSYVKASAGFYFPVKKLMFSLDVAGAYYHNKWVSEPYDIFLSGGNLAQPATQTQDFEHLMATPALSYKSDRLDLYVGARMEVMAGSRIDTKFHIMPEVKASYSIVEGLLSVYGRLESGYQVQNTASLLHENPFVGPLTSAFYSREKFKAQIGLSGVFSSSFRYEISAAYGQTDNALAWINYRQIAGDGYLSYYVPGWDNIQVFDLKVSGDYTINPSHRLSAFAQYLHGSSDTFSSALYTPDFRIGASYRGQVLRDRIGLSGRIVYNGASKGFEMIGISGQEVDVDGYVEFQAEASYRFADHWSLFAQANNTIDGRAVRFYGYDWCGTRALIGVRFNF